MFEKLFKRKIEDFTCDQCGVNVKGNGYTNHCPNCLWSKHVDNNPGDRASNCCGPMQPKNIEQEGKEFILTHICKDCGHQKRNKISKEDNFDAVVNLTKKNQDF